MSTLKENYHTNMTLKEAETLVLKTLKQVMEEKISVDTAEVAVIRADTKKLELRTGEEINQILTTLE